MKRGMGCPNPELFFYKLTCEQNITCTEFAGTELFITTASMEEDEGTAEEIAHSGALYKVDVGVQGLPHYKFRLSKQ